MIHMNILLYFTVDIGSTCICTYVYDTHEHSVVFHSGYRYYMYLYLC
jgi:hypothetical protein